MNETGNVLRATVNCDMGEGYGMYKMGDDEALMKTIHLANVACGFHASDFTIMDKTVLLAKSHSVLVGAHPSLPDRQGFGRREMAMEPDGLASCFTYQVGALSGFLLKHGMKMNHLKPHGSAYGMSARSFALANAVVRVAKTFGVAFVGLAGTYHQSAANELGVRFIAEWFADMEYDDSGKLLITREHETVPLPEVEKRVRLMLTQGLVTTNSPTNRYIHIGKDVSEVSICCHSDTPGAVEIAKTVKRLVDQSNMSSGIAGPI